MYTSAPMNASSGSHARRFGPRAPKNSSAAPTGVRFSHMWGRASNRKRTAIAITTNSTASMVTSGTNNDSYAEQGDASSETCRFTGLPIRLQQVIKFFNVSGPADPAAGGPQTFKDLIDRKSTR